MEETLIDVLVTAEAFDAFIDDPRNAELASEGKYGIHELINDEYVTKTITIDDISKYKFAKLSDEFLETPDYNDRNAQYYGYPFVELI